MVQIILLIIGIISLFKGSFSISKKSELRQPNLRTFGIFTIVTVIFVMVIGRFLPDNSNLSYVLYTVYLFIPIIAAIKLKQQKVSIS
jgi:Ca2+/Na+ antiporter